MTATRYSAGDQAAGTISPHINEGNALVQAARELAAAQEDPSRLEEAVSRNCKLWILFATDAASDENTLPRETKENILNLARFIEKQTRVILAEDATDKLDDLITINRNVAQGLFEAQPDAQAAAESGEAAAQADTSRTDDTGGADSPTPSGPVSWEA